MENLESDTLTASSEGKWFWSETWKVEVKSDEWYVMKDVEFILIDGGKLG